jgi:DNA-directed RNA polymerase specialized sigma24 family protein
MATRVDAIFLAPAARWVKQHASRHVEDIFEGNRHRVFSIAYYMTSSEPAAESVMVETFTRAFRAHPRPTAEQIDKALVNELREEFPIGTLTLKSEPTEGKVERTNTRRTDLEEAVAKLPATERMIFLMHDVEGYDHARIARTMSITEDESKSGLFQARLGIRNILAAK